MGTSKKRKLIYFSVLSLLLSISLDGFGQCDHIIDSDTDTIDGNKMNIQAGDVICLEAGAKPYLLIKNIDPNDNFNQPVTIQNHNGQLIIDTDHVFGISIRHSNNIILSGKGDSDYYYGIHIRRVEPEGGSGVGISQLSSKVEVKGLEIANTGFAGILAKTDPFCKDGNVMATRDQFTQYDIIIHDNYIHDTEGEGMYIGSSKYLQGFPNPCPGQSGTVMPHVNVGVKVYNNRVERSGWDALQVSSAVSDCDIHDNYIYRDSEAGLSAQMSGILIGGGSKCDCYNNKILEGKGDAIEMLGAGNQRIYNNLIVEPGQRFNPGDPNTFKHGIFVGHIFTETNASLYLYNNTIVKPRADGIKFQNEHLKNNKAYNNVILDPGSYEAVGDRAYINLEPQTIELDRQNNFLNTNVYSAGFDSPANNDYDLNLNSPLINSGRAIAEFNYDIENRSRPHGGGWDIGAYECHKPGVGIDETPEIVRNYNVYPNPVEDILSLDIHLKKKSFVILTIRNSLGQLIFETKSIASEMEYFRRINTASWSSGMYTYTIRFNEGQIRGKLIKK